MTEDREVEEVMSVFDDECLPLELGDIVELKENWSYSASTIMLPTWKIPVPGDRGVVWYLKDPGRKPSPTDPVWVTFFESGKFCVYPTGLRRVWTPYPELLARRNE